MGVSGVTPVKFETAILKTAYGQWLAAPVKGGSEIRIGVISAQALEIEGFGAAMGIRMDEQPSRIPGVRITGLAEESPSGGLGRVISSPLSMASPPRT